MIDSSDINDIEQVRLWAVEHDAVITARWEEQWRFNLRNDERVDDHSVRIRMLERRMAVIAATSALIGAGLGGIFGQILLNQVGG
jgi:hypothetical protein